MNAVLVAADMLTPYGMGLHPCWEQLIAGKSAIHSVDRFDTSAFSTSLGASVDGIDPSLDQSMVVQLLTRLLHDREFPPDTTTLLATTVGEIDFLERHVLTGSPGLEATSPASLLEKTRMLTGQETSGSIISAACASSTVALAEACSLIRSQKTDSVLVLACDALTEFVYSGFSTLMALDPGGAKPFDKQRKGLSLGEAAAFAWVMSERRAREEGRPILSSVSGYGISNDANHMTGPSRDGSGLAQAIHAALDSSGLRPDDIGAICAHGTGTVFNDSMEMKAFRHVFKEAPLPTYSIKGAVGHTLGAAGLLEALIVTHSLSQGLVPGTPRLQEVDPEAMGWVSPDPTPQPHMRYSLTTNSGFGGVNAALILGAPQLDKEEGVANAS